MRPEKILKEALKMILKKWKDGKAEYPYVSEQFRSLRQVYSLGFIQCDKEFTGWMGGFSIDFLYLCEEQKSNF